MRLHNAGNQAEGSVQGFYLVSPGIPTEFPILRKIPLRLNNSVALTLHFAGELVRFTSKLA